MKKNQLWVIPSQFANWRGDPQNRTEDRRKLRRLPHQPAGWFAMTACVLALVMSLAMPAFAAEFTLDETTAIDGMSRSWYQGYTPVVKNHVMTLCLPIKAENCVGDITASLALDDPNVFVLSSEPKTVTVSPRDGIYPIKLNLPLERYRRNGDFPATITIKGVDSSGKEIVETMPYTIRIRDGYGNHETLTPVISNVTGNLDVGNEGDLTLTIANSTSTISLTDAVLTVTDTTGEVLMSGSNLFPVPEILPGKSESVTIPMTVKANATISQHTFEVSLSYKALGKDAKWTENFTLPVTQAIRLEQGGVQLPTAIAGELGSLTLPLMNMGKGELNNVMVKLEMEGVLDAQSVLVGTIVPGETKQAKLTFTPFLTSAGTHSGIVTYSCEDSYGNQFSQTLEVTLTVDEPLPEVEEQQTEEKEPFSVWTILLIVLCATLAAALIAQSIILNGKLHKLEEERL